MTVFAARPMMPTCTPPILFVSSTIGFCFKVVFGLIDKNEQKSDDHDKEIEKQIDNLTEKVEKRSEVDKELFMKVEANKDQSLGYIGALAKEVAYMKAQFECLKEKS